MPNDLALAGVLIPGLLLLLGASAALWVVLDRLLARLDVYRHAWHAPLLRLSLFVILFACLAFLLDLVAP